jgi:1,4-dihydroxy-2-naphthoate octaprenyltransferase
VGTSLKIWWRALRAYSFSATIIPVVCAFLFVRATGAAVDWRLFPLMLFCALLLHAGVNLLNDYYDFTLGFDTPEARGSSGLLTGKKVAPVYMLVWGRFYVFGGVFTGLILAALRGWPLLAAGIAGAAGAWFYSNRIGYKYKGLGEPFVFLLMGPLLFFSAAFTACGTLPAYTIWPAVACGCLVTAIMLINNLRDVEMDRRAGFVTLPMRTGAPAGRLLFALLFAVAYLIPAVLFAAGTFRMPVLLPVLSLPAAARLVRRVLRADHPAEDLANGPQSTAGIYLLYGLLLGVGLFFSR